MTPNMAAVSVLRRAIAIVFIGIGVHVVAEKNTRRYFHVDGICLGHNLETLNDLSIIECQQACDKTNECYGVLFSRTIGHVGSAGHVTSACIMKTDECRGENTRQFEMYVKRKEDRHKQEKDVSAKKKSSVVGGLNITGISRYLYTGNSNHLLKTTVLKKTKQYYSAEEKDEFEVGLGHTIENLYVYLRFEMIETRGKHYNIIGGIQLAETLVGEKALKELYKWGDEAGEKLKLYSGKCMTSENHMSSCVTYVWLKKTNVESDMVGIKVTGSSASILDAAEVALYSYGDVMHAHCKIVSNSMCWTDKWEEKSVCYLQFCFKHKASPMTFRTEDNKVKKVGESCPAGTVERENDWCSVVNVPELDKEMKQKYEKKVEMSITKGRIKIDGTRVSEVNGRCLEGSEKRHIYDTWCTITSREKLEKALQRITGKRGTPNIQIKDNAIKKFDKKCPDGTTDLKNDWCRLEDVEMLRDFFFKEYNLEVLINKKTVHKEIKVQAKEVRRFEVINGHLTMIEGKCPKGSIVNGELCQVIEAHKLEDGIRELLQLENTRARDPPSLP